MKRLIVTLSLLVAVLGFATLAEACPTCKDSLGASDPQHQGMVQGYFYSILFMMAMPFLLFGTFSSYMYLEVRRARAARQAEAMKDAGEFEA